MTSTPQGGWLDGWQQTGTLVSLRELTDLARRVTPSLARRAGLTRTELDTLDALMVEPLGPSEVAHRLGVSSAAATGIVDRLVAHGHAERRPHQQDGRRTVVAVTDSGRAELVGHLMPMFIELAELDRSFTEAEREVVERYLLGAARAMRRLL